MGSRVREIVVPTDRTGDLAELIAGLCFQGCDFTVTWEPRGWVVILR
jgi:hypothetical protein